MSNLIFETRRLQAQTVAGRVVLDAVAVDADQAVVVFTAGTAIDGLGVTAPAQVTEQRSISEAPVLMVEGSDPLKLEVDGKSKRVKLSKVEHDLFEGLNTGLAMRNGESAQIVADWLSFHVQHHGLQAALIVDQAEPKSDPKFVNKLKKKAKRIDGLRVLVVVDADVPLGAADLGPEAHPMNVPTAPGKDRMDAPKPDPWRAPLGNLQIFELMKHRFLAKARAVMNIEVHDLLAPAKGPNVFDRAVASTSGMVVLAGKQAFPWRVRKDEDPTFGDHICLQFDSSDHRRRWCVAPSVAPDDAVWRLVRVVGCTPQPTEAALFYRCMSLRHPTENVSAIVPKTSLIKDAGLIALSQDYFDHNPVLPPKEKLETSEGARTDKTTIVTTMKNEGPFILEWLAYHRAIGVDQFLVYTNDCDDGTDDMFDLLQAKGIVQHRQNRFREMDLKPQHAALQDAEKEPQIQNADWVICMDVDEYINIHTGDGTLRSLFKAVPDANMISMTWRLFGNGDIHEFRDEPLLAQFTRCARQAANKPHQAWGFKTLFRTLGIFKKLGVHRPKGLKPQLHDKIAWVNGSGQRLPQDMYRNAWRSTTDTYGYDLVSLNHYAVRSAESFLVKRDRGRVNHVDRDQGLAYWFRMNNNEEEDRSIQRMLPAMQVELDKMMADPELAAMHAHCVNAHKAKIEALKATENYANFYKDLTGHRLEKLARMHAHFGANVFLSGPDAIPDEVVNIDTPAPDYFFTVEKTETAH
jgi:hypothetical protein